MKQNELYNCPCCGKSAITLFLDKIDDHNNFERLWYVECQYCFLRTGYYNSEGEAVLNWNNRVPGWISCTEALPEPETDVLVTDGKYAAVAFYGRRTNDWLIPITGPNLDEITHWASIQANSDE